MPNYTYRCDGGHVMQISHPMAAPVRSKCEHPGCLAAARVQIQAPEFLLAREPSGYRSDLARWSGDKRAFVGGSADLARLVDQTKREVEATGGSVGKIGDKPRAAPPPEASFDLAYDQALNDLEEK